MASLRHAHALCWAITIFATIHSVFELITFVGEQSNEYAAAAAIASYSPDVKQIVLELECSKHNCTYQVENQKIPLYEGSYRCFNSLDIDCFYQNYDNPGSIENSIQICYFDYCVDRYENQFYIDEYKPVDMGEKQ